MKIIKKIHFETIIIGGGPAGLTAAYSLSKAKKSVCLLEASGEFGGISRTPEYKGCYFDIGGHRFFSKSKKIMSLWQEIMPNMKIRPRLSRIYYKKKFFNYPLSPIEAFKKLGILESILCALSYLYQYLKPKKEPGNFSEWIKQNFGNRLYQHFFKTYTEKVWGIPCEQLSADWAAQRIKGLSLYNLIKNAFIKNSNIKSLIKTFLYPPKGPGQLWTKCAKLAQQQGAIILTEANVTHIEYIIEEKIWRVTYNNLKKNIITKYCKHLISTTPLKTLISRMIQSPIDDITLTAAKNLKYRDFLIVSLILKDKKTFTDNWLYIHDPDVLVGRIQNFKSWSPQMISNPNLTCYGMEYFCNQSDDLWKKTNNELINLAKKELFQLNLVLPEDIIDGTVIRQPYAYPVYDHDYKKNVNILKSYLKKHCPNLHCIGRNGMHKYNNQDHSMMTALLTCQNIINNKLLFDVWAVNQDAEYCEEGKEIHLNLTEGLRDAPIYKKNIQSQ